MTFYSEKCGPAGDKIKSCARPTCIPIDQATTECPNPPKASNGPIEPIVVKQAKVESGDESREPNLVGKVKVLRGSVSITRADGKKVVVEREADLHENESLNSSNDSGAVLQMEGGNKVHVHADTQVVVKEFSEPKSEGSRKSLIHLLRGKIRNQVEQRYNGKTSYFKVSTKTAVAGVRGTDFVVEYSEKGVSETRFHTLEGKVMVSSHNGQESKAVVAGEGLIVRGALPADSSAEFVPEAKFLPVFKIPADQIKTIDAESRVDLVKGKPVVESLEICKAPLGRLDQCAWRLKGADCIRTRCNANGDWAEETKLPSSLAAECPTVGARVDACNY